MKKLTQFQKEEILGLLHVRMDTITEDDESADEFETVESLNDLERKIEADSVEYSEEEKKWMVEEFECRIEVFSDFGGMMDSNEKYSRMASIKSLYMAIENINS